jgi:hypothetical protein
VSLETRSLALPAQAREQFLAQARAIEQRAQARGSSSTELELALGVLLALCGASGARRVDP